MRRVVKKRQDKMRTFFDSVAGRLGKDYVPGKSWKSLAEALLRLMPPMIVADLGAGEGAFSLLLAQQAKKVIAVDSSAKMIEVGRDQALRHGIKNRRFPPRRHGRAPHRRRRRRPRLLLAVAPSRPASRARRRRRLQNPPSRRPHRRPRPARSTASKKPANSTPTSGSASAKSDLESMLQKAGFAHVQTSVVDKEPESPQFQTLLAVANKPG